jgi:hypothetical protein
MRLSIAAENVWDWRDGTFQEYTDVSADSEKEGAVSL